MSSNKYTTIIGAEIHVELKTKSKMFCGCRNDPFNANDPNIYTCPVCLGLPGALPVPNEQAIKHTILLGLALNCTISNESIFDRKHYFYPDLPKGYQISQQGKPLCKDGYVDTSEGRVRINRVHLEEDTAKLIHEKVDGKRVSLIDFNRSGVPLVEIVTEPDIKSANQAKEFLKKIRTIVRFLNISDADMEKGSMRLEANISLSNDGNLPNYKVEVKNINSFNFYARAVEFEEKRQAKILESGKVPVQETRGWDLSSGKTVSQRLKESAQDYGYFPDPDIPPLDIPHQMIDAIKNNLPMLPDEYEKELISLGVRKDYASLASTDTRTSNYLREALGLIPDTKINPNELAGLVINKKVNITKKSAKQLVDELLAKQSEAVTDAGELTRLIDQVITDNNKVVNDYISGKQAAFGYLMGQIMKLSQGKADANIAKEILTKKLKV